MAIQGDLRYEVVEGWEQLPKQYKHLDVPGVAVDSHDRVYVLTRYDSRVLVYERDGSFVMSFADGLFSERTHGITIGPDDSVYCVDDGDHTLRKFSPDGKLLMTIGTPGVKSDTGYEVSGGYASIKRSGPPFNRPTNVAIAANGDLYVSDGYGNARVHRFTADGKLIQSWGDPGNGPGQFNWPHDIRIAADGRVFVADRENDRIQIFSPTGEFITMWTHVQRPSGLFIGKDGLIYVAENWWKEGMRSGVHGLITEDLPGRVCALDPDGKVLVRWGGPDRTAPGNFVSPHGICVDSHGDMYVGEVTYTSGGRAGLVPLDAHSFQKFVRR